MATLPTSGSSTRPRRYEEAFEASEQALELDPNFVNAFWWKGISCAGKRDFPASIACVEHAIAMVLDQLAERSLVAVAQAPQ